MMRDAMMSAQELLADRMKREEREKKKCKIAQRRKRNDLKG